MRLLFCKRLATKNYEALETQVPKRKCSFSYENVKRTVFNFVPRRNVTPRGEVGPQR
jgi:hypothetical protein